MTWIVALFFLLTTSTANDELRDSLQGVQKLMTGTEQLNEEFYVNFVSCLNFLDPILKKSVDAQWEGFREYYEAGDPADPWLPCPTDKWFEVNCSIQEHGNLPIWEPCNYASNIAYYHTTTEICAHREWSMSQESVKSIGKAFASLGLGSSFMHGSRTNVGGTSDRRVNDLFAWIIYQEAFKALPTDHSSIIIELGKPRNTTASQDVDTMMKVYIEQSPKEWGETLLSLQFPELRRTMCAFFISAFSLTLPESAVEILVSFLLEAFSGMDEELATFCTGDFLDEFRKSTAHFRPLPAEERREFFANMVGTVGKLIYAFLWQEEDLFDSDILLNPTVNAIGQAILPTVNKLLTGLETFQYSSPEFQSGKNFYPGSEWCDKWNPHSKWHLQTGIALPSFTFLADEMHKIFKKNRK